MRKIENTFLHVGLSLSPAPTLPPAERKPDPVCIPVCLLYDIFIYIYIYIYTYISLSDQNKQAKNTTVDWLQ